VKNGTLTARLNAIGNVVEDVQSNAKDIRPAPQSVIGRVIQHGGLYVGPLPTGDTTRLVIPGGSPHDPNVAIAAVRIRRRTVAVLVGTPVPGVSDVRRQLQELVDAAASSLTALIVKSRDPELEALRTASSADQLVETLVRAASKHLARPHAFVVRDGVLQGRFAFVDGGLDAAKVRTKNLNLNTASIVTRAVQDRLVLLGPCSSEDPALGLLSQPAGEFMHLGLVPIAVRRRTVCLLAGFVAPDQSDRVAPFLRRLQKHGSEAFAALILKTKGDGVPDSMTDSMPESMPNSRGASDEQDGDSEKQEETKTSDASSSLAVVGLVLVFILLVSFWYGLFFNKNPVREIRRLVPSLGWISPQRSSDPPSVGQPRAPSSMEARMSHRRGQTRVGHGAREGAD
jgi:hypothetical protein